jgi:hypothetical protein
MWLCPRTLTISRQAVNEYEVQRILSSGRFIPDLEATRKAWVGQGRRVVPIGSIIRVLGLKRGHELLHMLHLLLDPGNQARF